MTLLRQRRPSSWRTRTTQSASSASTPKSPRRRREEASQRKCNTSRTWSSSPTGASATSARRSWASRASSLSRGRFVGAVLEDVTLPILPQHGTVALVRGSGPVLLYRISEHDTRILVDVLHPLPQELPAHIPTNIVPQLPESAVRTAIAKDRLRRMPNSFLPAVEQNGHS